MDAVVLYKKDGSHWVQRIGGELVALPKSGRELDETGWFMQGGNYWKLMIHKWYGKATPRIEVERIDGKTYECTGLGARKMPELRFDSKKVSYTLSIPMTPRENDHVGVVSLWQRGYQCHYATMHSVIYFNDGVVSVGECVSTADYVLSGTSKFIAWDPVRRRLHAWYGGDTRTLDVMNDRWYDMHTPYYGYVRDGILHSWQGDIRSRYDLDTGKQIDAVQCPTNYVLPLGVDFALRMCHNYHYGWDITLMDLRSGEEYELEPVHVKDNRATLLT